MTQPSTPTEAVALLMAIVLLVLIGLIAGLYSLLKRRYEGSRKDAKWIARYDGLQDKHGQDLEDK